MPRQGLFPSQQFHCMSGLITIHINVSLLLFKGHRVPAHEKFFYSFPLETDFFFCNFWNSFVQSLFNQKSNLIRATHLKHCGLCSVQSGPLQLAISIRTGPLVLLAISTGREVSNPVSMAVMSLSIVNHFSGEFQLIIGWIYNKHFELITCITFNSL